MKARGAVMHSVGAPWKIEDLEIGEPNDHEVLVRVVASGLCHSDDHVHTGDLPVNLPMVGGHEGAGIVEKVGKAVTRVKVGDHVSTSYIPSCGTCPYCARGKQYICNNGAGMELGLSMDGTPRFFLDGKGIGGLCRLGTFSNWIVISEQQCIPIDKSIPLDLACLVSCGVATGWGSAVNVGQVRPGDVVLVVGVGGVGMNAVQGARHAGAGHLIVAEPVEFKRQRALELGATEAYPSVAEALPRIHELTNGQGTDVSIITVGRVDGDIIGEVFQTVGKAGTLVLTAVGQHDPGIAINPQDLTNLAKSIRGVMFGNCNPTADIPKLLAMYKAGQLKLDELVTRRYRLDEINEAFADMHAGKNIRGVLVHDH
jgi:S-(hydroxymethyl)glutathione dehydrogenase/alcohol dehydrogenase